MEDKQLINEKNSFDQVIDEITTYYFQQIKIVNIFNVNTIKQQLLDEVRKLYLPALVDDINHYRLNVDESSTPEEQYMTYCRLFNREKLTELHTKYPLLDKWVHNTVERYKTNLKFLSDAIAIDYDEIVKVFNLSQEAKDKGEALSIGLVGNAVDIHKAILDKGFKIDIITDQTSAHDPLNGYVPQGYSVEEAKKLRQEDPKKYVELLIIVQNIVCHLFCFLRVVELECKRELFL